MAGLRRLKQIPVEALGEKKIHAFIRALRERLLEKDSVFSKKYLKLLVEEIRYQNRQLVMKGSYTALVRMVGENKRGTPQSEVPTFGLDWLPGQDSNLRPAGYKCPSFSTGLGLSLHPPARTCRGGCRALLRRYWAGSAASSLCTVLPTR